MDHDISQTKDSLQQFDVSGNSPSGTLAALGEEYSSFWQGPGLAEMAAELGLKEKSFVTFGSGQTASFSKAYYAMEGKGKPLLAPIPPDVFRDALARPHAVHERAHLVLIYGVLLTEAALNESYDRTTVTKLRWNLRLSIDDARLLLEPSDLNMQALMILAFHVQEVTTPSLSWMVFSIVCRMLQALGVNARSLDPETRERRLLLAWTFNAIDKNLALIFGRPPAMHKITNANLPIIPVHKLLEYRPHQVIDGGRIGTSYQSTFGAHFLYFMHRSSEVTADIWSCLYEDSSNIARVREKLDDWHQKTTSTLEACLVAEQPFMAPEALDSMRLGIKYQHFNYNYFKVLLIRSRPDLREECISSSQQILFLLEDLVSDSSEVFNGVIWVILYCPFTPFFILFGEVLSKGNTPSTKRSLKALETMSSFLNQMRSRHPQAAKLHTIATTFVQYAQQVLRRSEDSKTEADAAADPNARVPTSTSTSVGTNNTIPPTSLPHEPAPDQQHPQDLLDLFNDPAVQDLSMDMDFWLPNASTSLQPEVQPSSMEGMLQSAGMASNDAYGFFADSNFDWLSWDAMTDMSMQ
ncbi:uncharacterized protein LTR77_008909 [Saxophila tyrrhenica]|uniref:Xylanolytic transcriptional activator regulatory domain-containing protein n=1 Tax=Saxophila tyrrhenica TaxID=1690608 RepID=A0AAV9NZ30_9PEZI|nr:hypothetical protein LTR77_008909 [Saxophila tyrrhenica]